MALIMAGSVQAQDTLHCRGKIIDVGMSMEIVRQHCGTPDNSIVDEQPVHSGNRITGVTTVTTWHYNQPGNILVAVLVFDVHKLQSIEYVAAANL